VNWNPAQRAVVILALAFFTVAIAWSAVPFRTDAPADGKSKQCVPAALAIFIQGDKSSQTNSWLKYGYCADAAKARLATTGTVASLSMVFAAGAFMVLRPPRRRDPGEVVRA
jgi:hypothetical protein